MAVDTSDGDQRPLYIQTSANGKAEQYMMRGKAEQCKIKGSHAGQDLVCNMIYARTTGRVAC